MCHVTSGDKGSYDHDREGVAAVRRDEARRAAENAGAVHKTLNLPDCEVSASDPEQRRLVVDLIREVRPDVMITHHFNDYMADHNEVSKLVFDCSFFASVPSFETEHSSHSLVPPVFYMETESGLGFQPTEFVDITEVMERKVTVLEAHQSQIEWLKHHDDFDLVDKMKTMARFRGFQCGVEFAEGFVPLTVHPRATTHRILP